MPDIIETLHGISETRPEGSRSRFFTGSGDERRVNTIAIQDLIRDGIARYRNEPSQFSSTGAPQAELLTTIFSGAGLRINFNSASYNRFLNTYFTNGGTITRYNFPDVFGRFLNEVHIPNTPHAPSIRRASLPGPSLTMGA